MYEHLLHSRCVGGITQTFQNGSSETVGDGVFPSVSIAQIAVLTEHGGSRDVIDIVHRVCTGEFLFYKKHAVVVAVEIGIPTENPT